MKLGKELLKTRAGIVGLVIVGLAASVFAVISIRNAMTPAAVRNERLRYYVDSVTMKPFEHEMQLSEGIPIKAPSGGMTGYPAELCYWNADGSTRTDPTPVLLNTWLKKKEPTFCPVCGRLVVGNNPLPSPGGKAPPTKAEYEAKFKAPAR